LSTGIYKEFDAENKSVAFPFGFGLSYTTFNVSNLKTNVVISNASRTADPNAPIYPGGNVELWATLVTVEVTVSNTGQKGGAAVPQLYLAYPSEAGMPVRSLRGFEKIYLNPGESIIVSFDLMRRDLSYWDTTYYCAGWV
jgi:beta-glucosidase